MNHGMVDVFYWLKRPAKTVSLERAHVADRLSVAHPEQTAATITRPLKRTKSFLAAEKRNLLIIRPLLTLHPELALRMLCISNVLLSSSTGSGTRFREL